MHSVLQYEIPVFCPNKWTTSTSLPPNHKRKALIINLSEIVWKSKMNFHVSWGFLFLKKSILLAQNAIKILQMGLETLKEILEAVQL